MEKIKMWWSLLSERQRWYGLLVIVGILGMGGWWLTRPVANPAFPASVPSATQASATSRAGQVAASPTASSSQVASSHDERVFVDVQGAVKHPGLYQFSSTMRIADALKAAGGLVARADRQRINLAMRLTDQQQVYIPLKGEKMPETAGSAPSGSTATTASNQATGTPAAVVNLNTATVTELQQLTGIGEKKAQKIVDYRTDHGHFQSVKDLAQVPGFGEKTVANLQDQLTT
ncbi:MAG: helix-hairpin-helix domain-containing protein [Levilactobacillus brevis]